MKSTNQSRAGAYHDIIVEIILLGVLIEILGCNVCNALAHNTHAVRQLSRHHQLNKIWVQNLVLQLKQNNVSLAEVVAEGKE